MVIVHYLMGLPPVHKGGLIKFALDLAEQQCIQGHIVSIIVPGLFKQGSKCRLILTRNRYTSVSLYKMQNPLLVAESKGISAPKLFMDTREKNNFNDFWGKMQADIFHVHSLMGLPKELMDTAKCHDVKIVFTAHDYYGLCTNPNFLNYTGSLCNRVNWRECEKCCQDANCAFLLKVRQSRFYEIVQGSSSLIWIKEKIKKLIRPKTNHNTNQVQEVKLRYSEEYLKLEKYYRSLYELIDVFHFGSEAVWKVYNQFLDVRKDILYPMSNAEILDRRRKHYYQRGNLHLAFMGSSASHKGLNTLIQSIDALKGKRENTQLDIYCSSAFSGREYVVEHKPYQYSDLESVYENVDLVVVPSQCRETFCLVVLEALSFGVPVVCTELVGASYLVNKYNVGAVYSSTQELTNLFAQLLREPKLLSDWNENILSMPFQFDFNKYVIGYVDTVYGQKMN